MEHRISLSISLEGTSSQPPCPPLNGTPSRLADHSAGQSPSLARPGSGYFYSLEQHLPKQPPPPPTTTISFPPPCASRPTTAVELCPSRASFKPVSVPSGAVQSDHQRSSLHSRISPLAHPVLSSVGLIESPPPLDRFSPNPSIPFSVAHPSRRRRALFGSPSLRRSSSHLGPFHLTTSNPPKKIITTRRLFWCGFVFPPLWIWGTLRLHPRFSSRETLGASPCASLHPNSTKEHHRRPARRFAFLGNFTTRVLKRFRKNEVEVGTTSVVIVPRSKGLNLSRDSCDDRGSVSEWSWHPDCASPAERLDAAGVDSAEWLQPSSWAAAVEHAKQERRGAYRCLVAFLLLSTLLTIVVVISVKVHPISGYHSSSSSSHPSVGNEGPPGNEINTNNVVGTSGHSSPL